MYNLTKKIRFESAHRLAKGYEGKCKNIHGHSWNGTIGVDVEMRDQFDFGIDFSDLKRIGKIVEDLFDHKILLYEKDTDIIELCQRNGWEYFVFKSNPTCETIAEFVYDILESELREKYSNVVFASFVTIEETCTTSCTYKK